MLSRCQGRRPSCAVSAALSMGHDHSQITGANLRPAGGALHVYYRNALVKLSAESTVVVELRTSSTSSFFSHFP